MRVVLSALGRLHSYDLARELYQRGALERLIVNRRAKELDRYGVPRDRVCSRVRWRTLVAVWNRTPRPIRDLWNPHYFKHVVHDRFACRNLPAEADLVVAWAGGGLETMRAARSRGMVTVCERGSAHIREQTRLLEEEYATVGMTFSETDPRTMEREEIEYEEADYIAVGSSFIKRTFLERGIPESRLLHVPYGVDPRWFTPQPAPDRTFRVIHCGAASLRKGAHYLLQAFSELRLRDAELWFVGRVEEEIRPFLERYAGKNVVLRGRFPRHQLAQQYAHATVSCLASIEDGFPMVVLEAMACGLPVIVSENTGTYDAVEPGRTGWIVPIRSVDALKERILWCYEHRAECAEMGALARKTVLSDFTWSHYGDRVVAAYERILQGRGRSKTLSGSTVMAP